MKPRKFPKLWEKYEKILPCKNKGVNFGEIKFPNKWIAPSKLIGEMGVKCIHGKRGLQLWQHHDDFSLTPQKVRGKHVNIFKLSVSKKITINHLAPWEKTKGHTW